MRPQKAAQSLAVISILICFTAMPARADDAEFNAHLVKSNEAFVNKNYDLAEQEMLAAEKLLDTTSDKVGYEQAILLRKGQLLLIAEKYPEAETVLKQAIALAAKQGQADHRSAITLDFTLGTVYIKQKRFDDAIKLHLHGFSVLDKDVTDNYRLLARGMALNFNPIYQHFGRDPKLLPLIIAQLEAFERMGISDDTYAGVGNIYLGDMYLAQNKFDLAEAAYKKAREIFDKRNDERTAQACNIKLIAVYGACGRVADAETVAREALARAEKVGGPNDVQCGRFLALLGRIYVDSGKPALAEENLNRAKEILERNPNSVDMLTYLSAMMAVKEMQDKPDEAIEFGERAVALIPKLSDQLDEQMLMPLIDLSKIYSKQHKYSEAEAKLKAALAKTDKDNSPAVMQLNLALSKLYRDQGDYEQAEAYGTKVLQQRQKLYGYMHTDVAWALENLASIYRDQDDYAKANKSYAEAIAILNQVKADEMTLAAVYISQAISLSREGNFAEADKKLSNTLAAAEKILGENSVQVCHTLTLLSQFSYDAGKYDQAVERGLRALSLNEKRTGTESADVARVCGMLARSYLKLGDKAKAEAMKKRYLQITSKLPGAPPAVIADNPVMQSTPALAKQNQPVQDKWALVIGISNFKDSNLNLRYAAKDGKDFANFLTSDGHFARDHVKLLTDKEATRENIVNALGDQFLGKAKKDDLIVIYVSSHGGTDLKGTSGLNFLVPYDASPTNLLTNGIPMEWFSQIIQDQIRSGRVLLFLDVCHSGAATGNKGMSRERNFDATKLEPGRGQIIVCSSLANQLSWESKNYDNSVFTRRLIDALRSQGDKTTLSEAFDIMRAKVEDEVLSDRHESQTPVMKRTWNGDDIALSARTAASNSGKSAAGK